MRNIPSWKAVLVATGALAASFSNLAHAEPICDVVLTTKAFNTSDFSQSTKVFLKKRDDVCNSEYNSASEAVSSAQQSGGNIGYGGLTIGASDAKTLANGKYSVKDSKFCNAKGEELDSLTTSSARQQITDVAVAAWSKCIEATKNQLFVEYSQKADGTGITGTIHRTLIDGGIGEITGIASSEIGVEPRNVKCKVGTYNVPVDTKVNIPINKTKTAISCVKPADKIVGVSLTTTQGDPPWIMMASSIALAQSNLKALEDAIDVVRRQLIQFQTEISKKSKDIASVQQSVSSMATSQRLVEFEQKLSTKIANVDAKTNSIPYVRTEVELRQNVHCGLTCAEKGAFACVRAIAGNDVTVNCAFPESPKHCRCLFIPGD